MKLQNNMILEAGTLGTVTATVSAFLLITLLLVGLLLLLNKNYPHRVPLKLKLTEKKKLKWLQVEVYFQL